MTTNPITFQEVELNLIKNDLSFYTDLVLGLIENKANGTIYFGIAPYLSLFKYESFKYVLSNYPNLADFLASSSNLDDVIRTSRMRTKLFDDTSKRIDGMFDLLEWIRRFNEWHINQHKGLLAPIKRTLQDDFGIFLYNGHVVGLTHTGLFNLGYEESNFPATNKDNFKVLGRMSNSFGIEIGEYLGKMNQLSEFSRGTLNNFFSYDIENKSLKYKDEKSHKFLRSIFNETNSGEMNLGFLIFLTTINFSKHILNRLTTASPIAAFKIKFVILYHLDSGIRKLQNYYYPRKSLTKRSLDYIQTILKDKELRIIRDNSDFRNVLVHYKIKNLSPTVLNSSIVFFGLIEQYFQGRTYDEVNQILDSQIECISTLLEDWFNWHVNPNQLRNW